MEGWTDSYHLMFPPLCFGGANLGPSQTPWDLDPALDHGLCSLQRPDLRWAPPLCHGPH